MTTVSPGMSTSRRARAKVVVPADMAMAVPGSTKATAASAIPAFSRSIIEDLIVKPGSNCELPSIERGPAMDLLEEAALVEKLQVAPDGHVRNAQLAHEIGHADAALLPNPIEDERLPLSGEDGPFGTGASGRRSRPLRSPLAP